MSGDRSKPDASREPNLISTEHLAPRWMTITLLLAAAYNIIWGAWAILYPNQIFEFAGMEPPNHPQLWQCIGMIVGVYGIGYAIAARDPFRHWPIVLVGLLGKVFGPIGFAGALIDGSLPLRFGATIITNDLIWWVPFGMILFAAWRHHRPAKRVSGEGALPWR